MTTWSGLVAAWARRADTAVVTADVTWSGRELLGRAAGAAALLRSVAVDGAVVPALFTSTPTALAYVIGGAACGRPLAPLGPRLTVSELAPCIAALGGVLLAEPELEPLARALSSHVVIVDRPPPMAPPCCSTVPPDATAFVLHTSGTTGMPKRVPYAQDRMARRAEVNAALCSMGPGDVYASASPLHHVAGLGNYAVALAAGVTVAPLPRFTVDAWAALAAMGVTHALTVPTMLDMLLEAGLLALPALRVLQYGGSPIHPGTLRRTLASIPGAALVNMFGQTEGSPIACLTAEDHRRIVEDGDVDLLASVGRAAPGVEIRVEDPDGTGVGEVVARGDHLMLPGADGWLRTGDLGRIDGDGYLFLVARQGDRIVRGGENVYPVEVEHVLEEHPAVREAAIVGVPDRRWGEVIRAVVVPADPSAPPSPNELRDHARARLAGFKVPTEWTVAETLPRNAAGKLLRRELKTVRVPTNPTARG